MTTKQRSSRGQARWLSVLPGGLEPFTSSFDGTCRGCSMPYRVGDRIVCPGKGFGGYHPKCYRRATVPAGPVKRVDLPSLDSVQFPPGTTARRTSADSGAKET